MTPEERARIARTYGADVPESVTVQHIPRGQTALGWDCQSMRDQIRAEVNYKKSARHVRSNASLAADDTIRRMMPDHTKAEISAAIGMSTGAVQQRILRMGLTR